MFDDLMTKQLSEKLKLSEEYLESAILYMTYANRVDEELLKEISQESSITQHYFYESVDRKLSSILWDFVEETSIGLVVIYGSPSMPKPLKAELDFLWESEQRNIDFEGIFHYNLNIHKKHYPLIGGIMRELLGVEKFKIQYY